MYEEAEEHRERETEGKREIERDGERKRQRESGSGGGREGGFFSTGGEVQEQNSLGFSSCL